MISDTVANTLKNTLALPDFAAITPKLEKLESLIAEMKSISTSSEHPPLTDSHSLSVRQGVKNVTAVASPEPSFKHYSENFLDSTELNAVEAFLHSLNDNNTLKEENGHSVALFGAPYSYTGSKTPRDPPPIPPLLAQIAVKVQQKLGISSELNSVLVNLFPATTPETPCQSHLSKHSDDEPVILADSEIVTLSIGSKRNIQFEQIHDKKQIIDILEVENNSIYSMTRSSQAWFSHEVLPDSAERFSIITFRSVSEKFRRSLVVIGDSNTKDIKFSTGPGTVGASYPGKRIKASKVSNINAEDCIGYSNAFICCGTNDLRCENIKCEDDIRKVVCHLEQKIALIKQLCPKSKIFVSPVLPSRIPKMNRNITTYNNLVDTMLHRLFPDVWFRGIYSFLDNRGLLSSKLTRGDDLFTLDHVVLQILYAISSHVCF